MDNMTFRVELKSLDQETGVFTGHAAVFGNRDLGGDVIEQGAFARTLKAKGGRAVLLDSHDAEKRIGVVYLEEDTRGLKVTRGVLNLDKQAGRDALSDLAFQQAHGIPVEMSIGYEAVKKEWTEDAGERTRRLKEIKLWEVSLVTFAMNPKARVEGVKEGDLARIGELEAKVAQLEALLASKGAPPEGQTPPAPAAQDDDSGDAHSSGWQQSEAYKALRAIQHRLLN